MSELYMNTEEFAALVVNALDEQDYFKRGVKAHPDDIANAFAALSETIGTALSWAISKEHEVKTKNAVMQTKNLKKYGDNDWRMEDEEPALLDKEEASISDKAKTYYTTMSNSGSVSFRLPIDSEFDPIEAVAAMYEDEQLGYNEMKWVKRNNGVL